MKATILITVLVSVSLGLISGCESPLTDAQILESANHYAIVRGLQPQDYDVSLAPSAAAADRTPSPLGQSAPDFSQKVKSMTGADTRAVTYTPKTRRHGDVYTFYIDKNTGKLVMVMKRK